jgi:hypothetical protein
VVKNNNIDIPEKRKKILIYIGLSFASVIVILLIINIILFLNNSAKTQDVLEKETVDSAPYGNNSYTIELSDKVAYLTKCVDVNGISISRRTDELKGCPPVTKDDVKKLSLLNGTEGIVICNSFDKSKEFYQDCSDRMNGCNKDFQYIEKPYGQENEITYNLFNCRNDLYYGYSETMPLGNIIVKIELDKKTYDLISKGYSLS